MSEFYIAQDTLEKFAEIHLIIISKYKITTNFYIIKTFLRGLIDDNFDLQKIIKFNSSTFKMLYPDRFWLKNGIDVFYINMDILCVKNLYQCINDLSSKYKITFKGEYSKNANKLKYLSYKTEYNYDKYVVYTLFRYQDDQYMLDDLIKEYVNDCSKIKCMNKGECQLNNDYISNICLCNDNYFGSRCQYQNTCGYCSSKDCDMNKNCTECPRGLSGTKCEIRTCKNFKLMCGNNGICISKDNIRSCLCKENWFGSYCRKTDCKKNKKYCKNDGICSNVKEHTVCKCKRGYFGDNCEDNNESILTLCGNIKKCDFKEKFIKLI